MRNIVLRYQPSHHALSLTLPRTVSIEQGVGFIEKKRDWVLQQMSKRACVIPFEDGQIIPILSRNYRLTHAGGRGVIRLEDGKILVPGQPEFMTRRVREWLKNLAKEEITERAHAKAEEIGYPIGKITLRDTRSLWGSCTNAGNISFSWRLVLAEEEILDYVVSHEIAHLAELNHGPRFWKIVEELCPHWKASRRWLKTHGDALYRYG